MEGEVRLVGEPNSLTYSFIHSFTHSINIILYLAYPNFAKREREFSLPGNLKFPRNLAEFLLKDVPRVSQSGTPGKALKQGVSLGIVDVCTRCIL